MADIVNLRRLRKRAAKQEAEQRAAQNRLEHGRTKAERALSDRVFRKAERDLEGHRIENRRDDS
jgi:hypothetical protein